MSNFKPIETQEEFDEAIKGRLARQTESHNAELEQLKARNAELETTVAAQQATIEETSKTTTDHEKVVTELNARISGYETEKLKTTIALQAGLPLDLASRLMGEDEAALTADAQRLGGFIQAKAPVAPLKNPETPLGDGKDGEYKSLINNLNLEGE
jgi:uncharacterized coiled-coil protein SlyX